MAIDFPNSPRPESGDVYTGPNGVSYTFDGIKWIGQEQSSSGGAGLPDQTGQVGKFLTTDGNGNASWADAQGPRGDAATITLGTVTTGLPGSSVVINNTGDSADAVFNFTVPRGDQGLKGDTGLKGDQGDRGFRGGQGDIGPQGDKGDQGDPGPQGEQGLRGEQGEQGAPGQQGEQGVPGQKGEQGVPGQKGDQGIPGNEGAQGVPGSPGAAGAAGAKGDPGDTGPRGEKGDQGVPGNDSTVAGPKGDTGDQGVSVTLQGTKATIADLPATGSAGHGWIVTTGNGSNHLDGSLWFWNVTDGAWNDIGPIVGPQGDKGDPGDQGAKGDQGVPGNDGAPGAAGAKGDTGETGPQGDPGLPGSNGAKGDQGEPGELGPQGEQGVPGQQGEQGVPGVPGQGVSTGGTLGQVLTKLSSNDYDTGWIDQIDSTDRLVNGDQQLVLRGNGYLEFPDATVQTTAWTGLSAAEVTVSAVAPDLTEGALWYNSTDGRTYVKYGALWVDANPPVVPHASTYLDGLVVEGTGITTLAADSDITIHDITFTANGRIQLPAGGDIVDSSDRSLLGGTSDRLVNGDNTVVLGATGQLTFPDGFIIDTSTFTNTTMLFGAPNGESSTKNIVLSTGEITNTISIPGTVFADATGEGNTDPVSISGKNGVGITTGADGLAHPQYHWTFGTDGRLTLPDVNPIIRDDGGVSFINFLGAPGGLTLGTSGLDSVSIIVNDDGQGEALKKWEFKTNGGLEFPDGTIQATAYSSIYPYTVSATPPEANNLWFNIVDGRMYVNIYDEGTLWVDANPPVVPPVSTYLSGLTIDEQTISSVDYARPDVKIAGNLLPDQDLTYDLGSSTNQWNSLHIKDTTIYMSGRALSLTDEGLKVDGGAAISVLDGGVASTWLMPV